MKYNPLSGARLYFFVLLIIFMTPVYFLFVQFSPAVEKFICVRAEQIRQMTEESFRDMPTDILWSY